MAIETIIDSNGNATQYDTTDWSAENYYNAQHYGGPGTVHAGSGGVNPYEGNPTLSYIYGWSNTMDPATQALLTQTPNNSRDDIIKNLQALTDGTITGGNTPMTTSLFNTNVAGSNTGGALANVLTDNNAKYIGYAALAAPFLFRRNKWVRNLRIPLLFLGSYASGLGAFTSSKISPIMPAQIQPIIANPFLGSTIDTLVLAALTGGKKYRRRRTGRYTNRYYPRYSRRTYKRRYAYR